jgi:hypothetical protein
LRISTSTDGRDASTGAQAAAANAANTTAVPRMPLMTAQMGPTGRGASEALRRRSGVGRRWIAIFIVVTKHMHHRRLTHLLQELPDPLRRHGDTQKDADFEH